MRIISAGLSILAALLLLAGCAPVSPGSATVQKTEKSVREERCYQEFAALKKLDRDAYEKYRSQFDAINANYEIYKENKSLVDGSSSEVMLTEINKTLSLVCVRIKSAVYSNMLNRVDALGNL